MFAHAAETPNGQPIKTVEPWMRMALLKNSNSTYQAILIERGRLVCETKECETPYAAAMAMFDYTSVQVGEALAHARRLLRNGRPEKETVLDTERAASIDTDQTTQSSTGTEVVMHERRVPEKPWGKNLTRLGSMDNDVFSCSRRASEPTCVLGGKC